MFKQSWKQYISEVTGKEKKMSLMIFTSIHLPKFTQSRSLSRVFQQLKDQYVFSFLEIINSSKQWPRVSVTRYYCNRSSPDLIPCQRQSEQLICYFYRDFVNSGDENHDNVSDCVTRAHRVHYVLTNRK